VAEVRPGSIEAAPIGSAFINAITAERVEAAPPSAMYRLWAPIRRTAVRAISLPLR